MRKFEKWDKPYPPTTADILELLVAMKTWMDDWNARFDQRFKENPIYTPTNPDADEVEIEKSSE